MEPVQGYLRYTASTVERLQYFERAQESGVTLIEISDRLSLDDSECDAARVIAEHNQGVIQQRIDDLSAVRGELASMIKTCNKNIASQDRYAIITTLAKARRPT